MKKFSGAHENSHSKNTGLNPGSVEGSADISSPQHGFAVVNFAKLRRNEARRLL